MSYYFCGEILIFSLSFITLCLTTCPLCWHYVQCSNFGKICRYTVSNPRAGGASYSIDSHEAFPSGMYLKKNVYSMREHTKGVVTACKGGHDFQPLAVSYTIRLPLSLHPSNMRLSSDQGLLFVQIL